MIPNTAAKTNPTARRSNGAQGTSFRKSSPAVRCRQTVGPLASACKLDVVETEWLDEGSDGDYAFEQLRKLTVRLDPSSGAGGPVAACTHGDVIWTILERLARLGVDLGRGAGASEHGRAVTDAAHVGGHGRHHPGELTSRHVGGGRLHLVPALAHQPVDVIDPRGAHVHHDLTRARFRGGALLDDDTIEGAELLADHGTHGRGP